MPHYVTVPAEAIERFLESKGFERTVQFREVVYVRRHDRDPRVVVKVYTSVRVGAQAARGSGADSVKVCTVYDGPRGSFGIGKFPRIHRTGSPQAVLDRTYARMREAYVRGTEWIREQNAREARGQAAAVARESAWLQAREAEALRLQEKAEFARRERRQEEARFLSDPDFRAFQDQDPCSEPCPG